MSVMVLRTSFRDALHKLQLISHINDVFRNPMTTAVPDMCTHILPAKKLNSHNANSPTKIALTAKDSEGFDPHCLLLPRYARDENTSL
jgi:hypothetical protein